MSVCENNLEIVQTLLESNAELAINHVDFNGRTPLIAAIQRAHYNLIPILISHGANVEGKRYKSETILMQCIRTKMPELVDIILKQNPSKTYFTLFFVCASILFF
jgi:ankyrin repeat protein